MLYCFHLLEGRVRLTIRMLSVFFDQGTADNLRNKNEAFFLHFFFLLENVLVSCSEFTKETSCSSCKKYLEHYDIR